MELLSKEIGLRISKMGKESRLGWMVQNFRANTVTAKNKVSFYSFSLIKRKWRVYME